MKKIDFKKANNEQREAIECINGPLLIIAGPGTGKTFTLINRALNLIVNEKVKPSNIFFATFTEKAANELISRLSDELSKKGIDINLNEMYIGTFHSICLRILKDNLEKTTLGKNFELYDEFDQKYFIYRNFDKFSKIKDFDIYMKSGTLWDKCETIAKNINRLKEELVDLDSLLISKNTVFKFYGELIKEYDLLRKDNNFIDFSSIQVETYELLIKNEDILSDLQDKFKYVMIDEYQDTNHIQEKLMILLSKKHKNVCVVGDDDQAIYRFRGATVRNILEFPKHFSECRQVTLSKNYRSNEDIIDFYNNWMDETSGRDFSFRWDNFRYNKNIISAKKPTSKSSSVIQITTKEENYLNEKIYQFILELKNKKKIKDYNQIAFLFRSVKNHEVIKLANYLERKGIGIYSPRSNMFFNRNEIMMLIGCFIYMFPKYMVDLQKNPEKIVLSEYYKKCISTVQNYLRDPDFAELYKFIGLKAKAHLHLDENLDYGFSGLAYRLLEFEPFKSLLNIDLRDTLKNTRAVRNIGIFINLLIKFESLNKISVFTVKNIDSISKRLFNQYFRFLQDGGISEYEDNEEYAPSGCISFLTIHQSKGLEFPIVIVGSQGSVPKKQYNDDIENIINLYSGRGFFEPLELIKYFDFWRLFYVAFSRAQSLLILMADYSKANEPSKYFENLYNEIPNKTDITSFEFETIKDTHLKKNYSFTTDINAYQICPTQYMFYKELGYGMVRGGSALFGTIVHETLEDINKAIISKQENLVTDENINKWFQINYKTASKLNNLYLSENQLENALKQIINYKNRIIKDAKSVSESELPISISNDDYNINGKVDLVINENGKYSIVDFKTEKKPDFIKEEDKIERVRQQLETYAYILEKKYEIHIDSLKVFYTSELDSNPYVIFAHNDKHIKNTIKNFDKIVNRIEDKDFKHKCEDMKICRNCDLRFYCKKGR